MKPAITILYLILSCYALSAQTVFSSKDFDNNRGLLVHELPLSRSMGNGFVFFKEEKKGSFKLEKHDLNLKVIWATLMDFDPQLNVPQIMVCDERALIMSFTVREIDKSIAIELKQVDLKTGKVLAEAKQSFPQFQAKNLYPRISISSDLSKLLLSNYIPGSTGLPEVHILSSDDLSTIKTIKLDKSFYDDQLLNRFAIDNQGNVFFVSVNEKLFRMDGYFIPSGGTEPKLLTSDLMFLRPIQNLGDILVHVVEDASYFIVAAAANIYEELIGVKVTGFDFKNNKVDFSSTFDFTMVTVFDLYQGSIAASRYTKQSTLKTPDRLSNFHLQEMRVDLYGNMFLIFEKSLQKSHFQRGFNNGILPYTYNMQVKRKLQKSEDLIVLGFDREGNKKWEQVIQKYQVTRPFSYYISYVSDLSNNVLSFLTWTKKKSHSFQVNQIDTTTGEIIKSGMEILNDAKYTYHKNYTTWINDKILAITTQKNNRMNSRRIHLVKVD